MKEIWKHVKDIDEATLDNIAKSFSSCDINEIVYLVFTYGKISHGPIFSVYAFTAYCAIQDGGETEVIVGLLVTSI